MLVALSNSLLAVWPPFASLCFVCPLTVQIIYKTFVYNTACPNVCSLNLKSSPVMKVDTPHPSFPL